MKDDCAVQGDLPCEIPGIGNPGPVLKILNGQETAICPGGGSRHSPSPVASEDLPELPGTRRTGGTGSPPPSPPAHRDELPLRRGRHLPPQRIPPRSRRASRVLEARGPFGPDLLPTGHPGKGTFTVSSPVTYMARRTAEHGGDHPIVSSRSAETTPPCATFLISVEMTREGHPSDDVVPLHEEPRPDAGAVLLPAEETSGGSAAVLPLGRVPCMRLSYQEERAPGHEKGAVPLRGAPGERSRARRQRTDDSPCSSAFRITMTRMMRIRSPDEKPPARRSSRRPPGRSGRQPVQSSCALIAWAFAIASRGDTP